MWGAKIMFGWLFNKKKRNIKKFSKAWLDAINTYKETKQIGPYIALIKDISKYINGTNNDCIVATAVIDIDGEDYPNPERVTDEQLWAAYYKCAIEKNNDTSFTFDALVNLFGSGTGLPLIKIKDAQRWIRVNIYKSDEKQFNGFGFFHTLIDLDKNQIRLSVIDLT